MKAHRTSPDAEHTLAVFIDFENLALGFNGRRDRFQIDKVLERLVEKGKIVVKRAYCDWSRFGQYTGPLHESAIELIEIPKRSVTGKNSADIRLVVDAVDLAYSKDHIDTFCIVSGDSDFSPLVSKLKELGKHVIGLGLADATSNLLRDNCDEFIYYEDLDRVPSMSSVAGTNMPEAKQKMFALLIDSLIALRRENKDTIFSSMVKDTMKRKKPSFNEEYHGYRTFSELLEDAQSNGLVDIEKHKNSGTYVVTRFGTEPKTPPRRDFADVPAPPPTQARPPLREAPVPVPPTPAVVVKPPLREAPPPPPVVVVKPPVRDPAPVKPPPARDPAPKRDRVEAAPPPRDRDRRPPRPKADAPPAHSLPPDDDRPMLGRALLEDFDALDDEIPSYRPAKPPLREAPAKKPAAARGRAPAGNAPPAKKPPAEKKPAAEKKPQAAPPRPPQAPRQPAPPKPRPQQPPADDGFGAGLDL